MVFSFCNQALEIAGYHRSSPLICKTIESLPDEDTELPFETFSAAVKKNGVIESVLSGSVSFFFSPFSFFFFLTVFHFFLCGP